MVLATSNLARSIENRLKKTLETKLSHNMQPKKKLCALEVESLEKMSKHEQK